MPALNFVRTVWEAFRANSGLEPRYLNRQHRPHFRRELRVTDNLPLPSADQRLLDNLRVTSARPGTVKFELDIQKEHTNRLGTIHGGTIASMVDLGGSLALASKGLFSTGVSTDLSVTYLNAGGKIGDTLRAEATCDKFGKTLAYTSIRFMNSKDELVARGSHTKYVALAWKDEKNIIEELSPKKSS